MNDSLFFHKKKFDQTNKCQTFEVNFGDELKIFKWGGVEHHFRLF